MEKKESWKSLITLMEAGNCSGKDEFSENDIPHGLYHDMDFEGILPLKGHERGCSRNCPPRGDELWEQGIAPGNPLPSVACIDENEPCTPEKPPARISSQAKE